MTRKVSGWLVISVLFTVVSLLGCTAPATPQAAAPQPAAPTAAAQEAAPTQAPAQAPTQAPLAASTQGQSSKPVQFMTQLNVDTPASGRDKLLVSLLPKLQEASGTQIKVVTSPMEQLDAKLNLAVQAKGEVPDVFEVRTTRVGFHTANGNLQDLNDWAKTQSWYSKLSPSAIKSCTGPDGKLYCVPAMLMTSMMFYYTDTYPNGLPATTDEFLKAAAEVKKTGEFPLTGKISEVWGSSYALFPLIKSYGGSIADANGKIVWASPETVKVVEFLRQVFNNGYAPESGLAAGYDSQTPFMNGTAGSFIGGSWSYAYIAPIKTPGGDKFDNGSDSMFNAIKAGKIKVAPSFAAPGGKPVVMMDGRGWGIPTGATNVEGAKAFINAAMGADADAQLAYAFGCIPTLQEAMQNQLFANSFWTDVNDAIAKYGTAMDPVKDNYDQVLLKLADTVVKLVQDPKLDIMSELTKAQDQANALGK